MEVKIKEEFIKLDSLLKLSGLCSTGGMAKAEINNGFVTVNGEVCLARGKKIRETDTVQYQNEIIKVISNGNK